MRGSTRISARSTTTATAGGRSMPSLVHLLKGTVRLLLAGSLIGNLVASPAFSAQGGTPPPWALILPRNPDAGGYAKLPQFQCKMPIPPMTDMSHMFTFYQAGATQSVIDKQAMAAYVKRNRLVDAAAGELSSMTQRAVFRPVDRSAIAP